MSDESEFEYYQEKFRILEWKGGEVYLTRSEGHGWFDATLVDRNNPKITNVIYASPSSDYKGQSIRKKLSYE